MKKLLGTFVVITLVVSIGLFSTGCKEEGPTGPPAGGGGYGSGTISSTSTTQGNLSFTGQGVLPLGAGPSVVAVYDTVDNGLQILGYQQVSGRNYSFILVSFRTPGGVSARTYTIGGDGAFIFIATNYDTSRSADSAAFMSVSGSITVTSVSGTGVQGTFSINAIRLSPSASATFTGSFNVTYVRGRALFGDGGDQNPSAWSQHWHWPNGYHVQLEYDDPNRTATSVSVTGPGITGTKALTYETGRGSWNSWTSPSTPVSFGTAYPTGLPFTYTFFITDATGTWTATSTVSCFQQLFATNLSPTGTVSGSFTFSWTGIGDPNAVYEVQLNTSSFQRIWNSPDVSGTSVAYTGPALIPGTTYIYDVVVTRSSTCNEESFAQGSFTYQ